jgi:hypothetical protein
VTTVEQDTTRILLADGHALVRRGLRLILDAEPVFRFRRNEFSGSYAFLISTSWPKLTPSVARIRSSSRPPSGR